MNRSERLPLGAGMSIRRRLLAWLLPLLLFVLGTATLLDYRTTLTPVLDAYDQALGDAALAIAANLKVDGDNVRLELTDRALRVLQADSEDKVYFRVIDPQGKTVSGDPELQLPAGREGRRAFDLELRKERLRVLSYPVATSIGECVVLIAETMTKRDNAKREIFWSRMALDSIILLLTVGIVWIGVGLALQPLNLITRQVSMRSGEDLSPLPDQDVPTEVRPLVGALNRLFAVIGETQDGQRRFVENAAHQLRTPLAGLRGQIELATNEARQLLQGQPGLADRLKRVQMAADRLTHLANQMLTLARSDRPSHESASRQRVMLPDLIDDVVASHLDLALARNQDLGAESTAVSIRAVAWELRELLGNLIDNAIRYTPEGGRITVRCGQNAEEAWLEVEDNGPGIADSERARVFERFYRPPEAPAGGSGLGLAIVKEIAALYQARVVIEDPPSGTGMRIRVAFPMQTVPA